MHHIIQQNIWKERSYYILINTIERLGLSYDIVKHIPYVQNIVTLDNKPYNTDRTNVFIWGGTGMVKATNKNNFVPGSLLNKNHDYLVYSQYYKHNLFNYDSIIDSFKEPNIETYPELFFARPVLDNKSFTGKVFTKDEFITMHDMYFTNKWSVDFEIQIAKPKKIQKEFRFWVVNGKVITGSLYRYGQNIYFTNTIDVDALKFAQQMVDIYQPAEAFVIDIVESNNEYKIMELGCINSAGFYQANLPLLIDALEQHFNIKI